MASGYHVIRVKNLDDTHEKVNSDVQYIGKYLLPQISKLFIFTIV